MGCERHYKLEVIMNRIAIIASISLSHIILNTYAPGMRIENNIFDSRASCPPSNMSSVNKVNINLRYNYGPEPIVNGNTSLGPYPMYRR